MNARDSSPAVPGIRGALNHEATPAELFTPKLITVLREGYRLGDLRADIVAGLTVAIVALPLSMAIAIASGTTPERGIYSAVVGGFLVSALGGSRFQVGGPAGAFIVLVAAAMAQIGLDGVLLATILAGLMLVAMGALRLGTYIKFIPYPVTVGFTAGIAVIIMASQIKDLLGLTLAGPEPGDLLPKLGTLGAALPTVNAYAVGVAAGTIGIILAIRRFLPSWPGMLVAIAVTSIIVTLLQLPVETIGSRFGGIPRVLPAPSLPALSLQKLEQVLPYAFSFALLGAIESLLSAVVADGMTGRRHRSNLELVAQGFANIGAAIFGGICVTGTIARTATNVRAGSRGPISGMLHSVFLLLFMLAAAPLASAIPLAALAGLLAVVAWNMAEKHAVATLLRSRGDAFVLLATFLLTIFRDLTSGIVGGFAIAALLFIGRMAKGTAVETAGVRQDDQADRPDARGDAEKRLDSDPDVLVYRISGAFFFAAAASVGTLLDRVPGHVKTLIVDFEAVPFLDSTAANAMAGVVRNASRKGVGVMITGARPAVRRDLESHGVKAPDVRFRASIAEAAAEVHEGAALA